MAETKYKDFQIAQKQSAAAKKKQELSETFTIGGEGPYTMYMPDQNQLSILMAAMAGDDEVDGMGVFFEFLANVFDEDSYRLLRRRIMDRTDPLGVSELMEVVTSQVKEWTGFLSAQSSGSGSSPQSAGKKSTGRAPGKGSTRSR